MAEVESFVSPTAAYLIGSLMLAAFFAQAIVFTIRYVGFKIIDRQGFSTPELQEFHLREMEREKGLFFTETRKQGLYALCWLLGSVILSWLVVPMYPS